MPTQHRADKRPNLVIVYPDQMRAQALGCMHGDPVVAPNLDRFAKESLVLTQAIANYPVCSPSRAMLMTGQYSPANGVFDNCYSWTAQKDCELPDSARCWSDVLSDAGYSLGYIGKWHLDAPREPYVASPNNVPQVAWNEWCPPERRHGFDFWYAYGTYDYHLRPMYWSNDAPRDGAHYVDQWGPEHETDLAIEYLRNTGGRYRAPDAPFALVVAMNPPHPPYDLYPEKYREPYADKTDEELAARPNLGNHPAATFAIEHTRNYFANITGVDDQFGRILAALREQGLDADTIVVFTSDHGNCLGAHGYIGKHNPYEEALRVPFLIRWPGHIAPRHDDLLLSVPDIAPTLLELMGAGVPAPMEGRSFAPFFLGTPQERPTSQLYVRSSEVSDGERWRGVRTDRYTICIRAQADGSFETELYDRHEDPYQLKNIALTHPAIAIKLAEEELRPWLTRIGDDWVRHLDTWRPDTPVADPVAPLAP